MKKKKYILTNISPIYLAYLLAYLFDENNKRRRQFSVYRCNMAGGGYADVPAIRIARSATDVSNDRPAFHADPRLEHLRIERLQRLPRHHHLDRRVSHDKSPGTEVQARITQRTRVLAFRLYSVYSALRTISFREDGTREC